MLSTGTTTSPLSWSQHVRPGSPEAVQVPPLGSSNSSSSVLDANTGLSGTGRSDPVVSIPGRCSRVTHQICRLVRREGPFTSLTYIHYMHLDQLDIGRHYVLSFVSLTPQKYIEVSQGYHDPLVLKRYPEMEPFGGGFELFELGPR